MPPRMSRRDFTRGVSALSLLGASGGSALAHGCNDQPRDENAIPFRHAAAPVASAIGVADATALRNRISLNVYSFNVALNNYIQNRAGKGGANLAASLGASGQPNVIDLVKFCQEQNIYALDATGYYWWTPDPDAGPGYGTGYPQVPSTAEIKAFTDEAKASGIVISGTGVQNNFASPYSDQRDSDLRQVKAWCEVAAAIGAPVLRVFAGPIPIGYGWDQVATWMVDCLAQCAEWGKEYGVKIGVQNHGDMLRTAAQCIRVLRMVDSEWFGAVNDTGYFLTPNPYLDIAELMPYSITLQVKESVRAVKNFQAAVTDLERNLVPIVAESGYTGWLPVETLQAVDDPCYDPLTEVPSFVQSLRSAMGGNGGEASAFCPYCNECADAAVPDQ
jgi:sugar phosphate isomerase/epimerase